MIERRFVKGAEVRATKKGEGDKATPALEGYAAIFGEDYVLYESKSFKMIERVKQGAFTRALEEKQDVRCCFNHNPDNVLARTTNGTLVLDQDKKGLSYDADLDARTHIAQDVRCFVDRGDVTGCSFAFSVRKQTWTEVEEDGFTTYQREIEDVDLYELGPVLFPAYEGTSVGARAVRPLSAELRTAAWAEGLPAEIRSKLDARAKDDSDGDEDGVCNCDCEACADCENKRSVTPGSKIIDFDRARLQADVDARARKLGLPTPPTAS
jgi:Escherichia/Staphylococcus phage prohead protease